MMMRRLGAGAVVTRMFCNFRLMGAPGWGQWFPPNMHQRGEGARNPGVGWLRAGGWWGGVEGRADGEGWAGLPRGFRLDFAGAKTNRRLSALPLRGRSQTDRVNRAGSSGIIEIRRLFCVGARQIQAKPHVTADGRHATAWSIKGLAGNREVARASVRHRGQGAEECWRGERGREWCREQPHGRARTVESKVKVEG